MLIRDSIRIHHDTTCVGNDYNIVLKCTDDGRVKRSESKFGNKRILHGRTWQGAKGIIALWDFVDLIIVV